jgi:hypothetical protein
MTNRIPQLPPPQPLPISPDEMLQALVRLAEAWGARLTFEDDFPCPCDTCSAHDDLPSIDDAH